LELELETDDAEHAADIVDELEAHGYDVRITS